MADQGVVDVSRGEKRQQAGAGGGMQTERPPPELVSAMPPHEVQQEKRRIMKNILLISLAFLFNFNAYQSLARLQSSLHLDEGMGVINSSILYAALVLSCLFLPKLIIHLIGHKWTIPLSFMGYILWMGANGYAVWETMVPASILLGFAAAPLWTAQCSYFTIISKRYAQLTGEPEQAVITRFFGIFFFFFQLSGITGSIISSTILKPHVNGTQEPPSGSALELCGVNDCPDKPTNETQLIPPDQDTVWIMLGVYIAIALAAVFLVIFLVDQLPPSLVPREENIGSQSIKLLVGTVRHLRHKEQLLLIPITMYSGFEQASYNAEFTKSFVSCPLGIWNVGFVTIPFGVVNAMVSFMGGRLVKHTGRLPIFLAGACVDLAIQITLDIWMPRPDKEYVLYILAALWGLSDGIWQTQINAMYAVLFEAESEVAFSNYRMWESVGFIIPFAYSDFLCTRIKLFILTGMLVLGLLGYVMVEGMQMTSKTAQLSAQWKEEAGAGAGAVRMQRISRLDGDPPPDSP